MKRKVLRWLLFLVMAPLLFFGGCYFFQVKVKGVPREMKLADCKQNPVRVSLTCPSGASFRMLLGVPEKDINWSDPKVKVPKPPPFQGWITVKQAGRLVYKFPISSATTGSRSNWLEGYGIYGGYILPNGKVNKGEDLSEPMDKYIEGGETYDVVVNFSKRPPTNSSLWLSWLTA